MAKQVKNNLILELHVPDFEIAKEFYEKLGFKIVIEDAPAQEPGYMTMKRKDDTGETLLNFYSGDNRVYDQSFFKRFPKNSPRGYAVEITIPVSNIKNLYREISPLIQENLVQKLKDKRDRVIHWQDFRLMDPFGFYIRFTDPIDWGQ